MIRLQSWLFILLQALISSSTDINSGKSKKIFFLKEHFYFLRIRFHEISLIDTKLYNFKFNLRYF
jgi:hypothetical protein